MEKAYDLKDLVLKLKAKGLDIAEDAACLVVETTFDWLGESATLSTNKVDDLLAPLYPVAKSFAMEQLDKVDGKVG